MGQRIVASILRPLKTSRAEGNIPVSQKWILDVKTILALFEIDRDKEK